MSVFVECKFNAWAIQTTEITGMRFKSQAISNTKALLDWLGKYGELIKIHVMEKPSKNFERA